MSFANMSPERLREIARRGGLASKPEQRAFRCDPALAKSAAALGGAAVPAAKRSFTKDNALAVECGRKGGQVSRFQKATAARLARAKSKESDR